MPIAEQEVPIDGDFTLKRYREVTEQVLGSVFSLKFFICGVIAHEHWYGAAKIPLLT